MSRRAAQCIHRLVDAIRLARINSNLQGSVQSVLQPAGLLNVDGDGGVPAIAFHFVQKIVLRCTATKRVVSFTLRAMLKHEGTALNTLSLGRQLVS